MWDTVILVLRTVVVLGAVFGALLVAHRWITKGRPGRPAREKQIAIVARQGLGAKAGIAIVDAAGRRYLLGVTEHAVTVLDTLGEVPATDEPVLVGTQPVTVARFEQELRSVTLTTGTLPRVAAGDDPGPTGPMPETVGIVVHGRPDPRDPTGPITQTFAILPARADAGASYPDPFGAGGTQPHARVLPPFRPARAVPIDPANSRRAVREAEQRVIARESSPLAGSLLSPATWRQTVDALKKLR